MTDLLNTQLSKVLFDFLRLHNKRNFGILAIWVKWRVWRIFVVQLVKKCNHLIKKQLCIGKAVLSGTAF